MRNRDELLAGLLSFRPTAWRDVLRAVPGYAAGWRLRRRVHRDIDDLMRGPGKVLREALTQGGTGPLVLFAGFNDFRQQIKYDLMFGAALAARGARVAVLTQPACSMVRRYWTTMAEGIAVHLLRDADGVDGPTRLEDGGFDVQRLLGLTYRGVSVGRWALATAFSRLRKSYSELQEPSSLAVVTRALEESYRATDAGHEALDRIEPQKVVFLEKGYTPAGELYEAALAKGIDVVQYTHGYASDLLLLKRFRDGSRFRHPAEPSASTWSRVLAQPFDRGRTAALRKMIREAYANGEWFNRKYGQAGKRFMAAEELGRTLHLDAALPTAVIFTHVGWDATFFYGQNLFADYDEWLIETIRAVWDIRDVNWVVRVHPDNLWKAKASGRIEDLDRDRHLVEGALGRIPDNVRWLGPDSDVRTDSLFDLADFCVTVRGTIGLEMASMGKQVVTGGTGRYSGYGFTLDSATLGDYFALLRRLNGIRPPSSDQTDLAARYVETLVSLRPLRMVSSQDRRLPPDRVGRDRLGDDLEYRFSSVQDLLTASDLGPLAKWILDSSEEDLVVS